MPCHHNFYPVLAMIYHVALLLLHLFPVFILVAINISCHVNLPHGKISLDGTNVIIASDSRRSRLLQGKEARYDQSQDRAQHAHILGRYTYHAKGFAS